MSPNYYTRARVSFDHAGFNGAYLTRNFFRSSNWPVYEPWFLKGPGDRVPGFDGSDCPAVIESTTKECTECPKWEDCPLVNVVGSLLIRVESIEVDGRGFTQE